VGTTSKTTPPPGRRWREHWEAFEGFRAQRKLLIAPEVADRLGVTREHVVRRAKRLRIGTRYEGLGRAGGTFLFSQADVAELEKTLVSRTWRRDPRCAECGASIEPRAERCKRCSSRETHDAFRGDRLVAGRTRQVAAVKAAIAARKTSGDLLDASESAAALHDVLAGGVAPRTVERRTMALQVGVELSGPSGGRVILLGPADLEALRRDLAGGSARALHRDPRARGRWYAARFKSQAMFGRVAADIAAAQGQFVGRPRVLVPELEEQALAALAARPDLSNAALARVVGVSRDTIRRWRASATVKGGFAQLSGGSAQLSL
jgi:hypothetical protein